MNASILLALVLCGAAPDALKEATERLQRGDASGAADAYETAVQQGATAADVYYNLGTAALKAGDVGRAVWALTEARIRSPWDADVLFNLDLARKANADTVVGTQETAWEGLMLRVPRVPLHYAAMLAWWLFCAVLVARGLLGPRPGLAPWVRRMGGLCVLLGVLLVLVESSAGTPAAVVMVKEAVVHGTESRTGPEAFRVHAGLTVEPLDEGRTELTRIRLGNGLEGFVASDALRRIGG